MAAILSQSQCVKALPQSLTNLISLIQVDGTIADQVAYSQQVFILNVPKQTLSC